MKILILLILIILIIIIVYIITVHEYSKRKKIPTAEAAKIIQAKTIKLVKDYTGKTEIEVNFPPAATNEILDNIQSFSQLRKDNTRFEYSIYSSFKLPCLTVELVPNRDKDDFPVIEKSINNTVTKYFSNYINKSFQVKVFFEKSDDITYYIYIVYATTKENIDNLNKLLNMHIQSDRQQTLAANIPVVDNKLEEELNLFSYEDSKSNS